MPPQDMPAAEVDVDEALVGRLLRDQHPDLAEQRLELLANGWDNVLFRLGDDLVARLPRRAAAAPLVEHEQRWLPSLAPRLPLPIPSPVRVGRPAAGYPWRWSVVPWFAGRSALHTPLADPSASATALGTFLAALHVPAPADAPRNPYRGIPLAERAPITQRLLDALHDDDDHAELERLWRGLHSAPEWSGPPVWVHGDTHPGNLVVDDGRLVAVVDWGDLCAGDPASDLAVAWMLFDDEPRAVFRAAVGGDADPALWIRARAWALAIGIALRASSADDPAYADLAARTIAAVVTDPDR